MSSKYTELLGGFGRAINYRPERFRVREFLHRFPPALSVNGGSATLLDFGMNGISFLSPTNGREVSVGDELAVVLTIGERTVFDGAAQVARAIPTRKGFRVGARLHGAFIDVPRVLRDHADIVFHSDFEAGLEAQRRLLTPGFRTAVGEAAHFVAYYRKLLDMRDERLTVPTSEREAVLTERAAEAFTVLYDPWRSICDRIVDECLEGGWGDARSVAAMKAYTELLVTEPIIGVPFVTRAYRKPLGYPGDFETMMQVYRNGFEGDSTFHKLFHRICTEHPICRGGRARKDTLISLIGDELGRYEESGNADRPQFRVTSLGCGPAVEVKEFAETRPWTVPTRWTLVDQEESALSLAYSHVYTTLTRESCPGEVKCLYLSFTQMISDPGLVKESGHQHFIYATGIFDYLNPRWSKQLIETLFDNLLPGGLLAVGNAAWPNHFFWSCDMKLDWMLRYRTDKEMLGLASDLEGVESACVEAEPNGAFHFLLLRRRG